MKALGAEELSSQDRMYMAAETASTEGKLHIWEEEYLRIPGVEADIIGMFQKRESCIFVDDPLLPVGASKRHAAKDDFGNLQS
jgi:hypothetical protein